jgi:hypothetical protein
MADHEHVVGLAGAIEALRAELTDAVSRGGGEPMRFRMEPIELSMQVVVTKQADGRIGWGALGIGGSYDAATTQTLKLRLQPVWQHADGTIAEDFTVADQQATPQRFGPRGQAPPSAAPAGGPDVPDLPDLPDEG